MKCGRGERRGMPRCRQSGAYQRFGAVNCRLRSPLARDEGDLLLPEPVKRTILATKSPAVWRMSVYHHEAVDVDYQVTGQLASHTIGETSPWLISVFFRKVYITGLLGWLALGGCLLALRRPEPGIRFLMIWAIGLLLVFSVFPISLALPDFIRKVSSYMEIFIAGGVVSRSAAARGRDRFRRHHDLLRHPAVGFGAAGRARRHGER